MYSDHEDIAAVRYKHGLILVVAEEDGCDWGGTMGVSHVYPNRDVLKDCQARGGTCPWCPPGSATYVLEHILQEYHALAMVV